MNFFRLVSLLLLLSLKLGLAGPLYAQEESEQLLDQVVVIVNEDVILLSELQHAMTAIKKRIESNNMQAPPEKELLQRVVDHMILEQLQLQEAKKRGMVIDDLTLTAALRNISEQEKMTLDQFRRKLEAEGIDYTMYREDLRRQIILERLNQAVVNNLVVVSEQEVDDYLTSINTQNENIEYRVSQIQVSFPETARPEDIQTAETKANDLFQKLIKGADFAQLAISSSDGRNALEGGDLGWNKLNELPAAFTKAVNSLKIGEYSRPIRSARGFHILLLRDTKGIERHLIKQVRARHILIKPNTLIGNEEVRNKLSDLRRQILQGADFSKLATEFSEDPGSKEKGGELGWTRPETFVKEFQQVVTSLPVNKISEPFQTQFGWHIVQVLERRDYDDTNEYQRDMARRNIFRRKAALEQEMWLRRIRSEAYIDHRIDV